MLHSQGRILTTHAGSLPRPSALTHLYALRARGGSVAPGELEGVAGGFAPDRAQAD